MKNILMFIGGTWVLSKVYEVGKTVGEIKGSIETLKDIRKEYKSEKKRIWETEARA